MSTYNTSVKELSLEVDKSTKTVSRSLKKFVDEGIISVTTQGNRKLITYSQDNEVDIKLTASDQKLLDILQGAGKIKRRRRTKAELEQDRKEEALQSSHIRSINKSFKEAFNVGDSKLTGKTLSWANTFALLDEPIEEYKMWLVSEIWFAYADYYAKKYMELYASTGAGKGLRKSTVTQEYLLPPYIGTRKQDTARKVMEAIKGSSTRNIYVSPMAYIHTVLERAYIAHMKYDTKPYVLPFPRLSEEVNKEKVASRITQQLDSSVINGTLRYSTLGVPRIELLASIWETSFRDEERADNSVTTLTNIKTFGALNTQYEALLASLEDDIEDSDLTLKEKVVAKDYITDILGYANGKLMVSAKLDSAETLYNTNVSFNLGRSDLRRDTTINDQVEEGDFTKVSELIAPDFRGTNYTGEDVDSLWDKSSPANLDTRGFVVYHLESSRAGKASAVLMDEVSLVDLIGKLANILPINKYGFINKDVIIEDDYTLDVPDESYKVDGDSFTL